MKKSNFGLLAEYITLVVYAIKFYRILHHRMRNYAGEIDLIVKRSNSIVFIEVKARSSNIDNQFLSNKQSIRIKKAAEVFINFNPKYQNFNIRFDLIIIRPYKLPLIIKNAW